MKTQYYTTSSLDGFIATEDDSLDWRFPLGKLDSTSYPAFIAEVGALTMGSATYRWMMEHADAVERSTGAPGHPLSLVAVAQIGSGFAELRHEVVQGESHGTGRVVTVVPARVHAYTLMAGLLQILLVACVIALLLPRPQAMGPT
jgi:hypothetical protein